MRPLPAHDGPQPGGAKQIVRNQPFLYPAGQQTDCSEARYNAGANGLPVLDHQLVILRERHALIQVDADAIPNLLQTKSTAYQVDGFQDELLAISEFRRRHIFVQAPQRQYSETYVSRFILGYQTTNV